MKRRKIDVDIFWWILSLKNGKRRWPSTDHEVIASLRVTCQNRRPNSTRKKDDDEKNWWFCYSRRYVYHSFIHSLILSGEFWPGRSTYILQILTQHFLREQLKTVFLVVFFYTGISFFFNFFFSYFLFSVFLKDLTCWFCSHEERGKL